VEQSVQKKRTNGTEKSYPALFAPFVQNPVVTNSTCSFCRGRITVRPIGTTYCCDRAQSLALNALAQQVESVISNELRDPGTDPHVQTVMSHLLRTVRAARSVDG
jgi:hypothetical protein